MLSFLSRDATQHNVQALEKHRKSGGPLKCKTCVEAAQTAERVAAAQKRAAPSQEEDTDCSPKEVRVCATCQQSLDASHYNRNQWNKKAGPAASSSSSQSKCRPCVDAALAAEQAATKKTKTDRMAAAQARLAAASTAVARVAAESEIAALQAERVSGLKAVRLSAGRGRKGGGRGRGRIRL
jgi:hypothetical protein